MKRRAVLGLVLAVTAAVPRAQAQSGAPPKDWWRPDVGVFGGFQDFSTWRSKAQRHGSDLVGGGVLGFRLGQDITDRWGWEGAYTYGVNNLRLFLEPGPNRPGLGPPPESFTFGARNHHASINPLFHLRPVDARFRPFVTAGLGVFWYDPTDEAQRQAMLPENAFMLAQGLGLKYGPAFNWGGGVKYNVHRWVQLRMDARNVITQNPHFNLPDSPLGPGAAFIARNGLQSGFQLTGGLGIRTGGAWEGAGPSPVIPPPPGVDSKALAVKLDADLSPIPVGTIRNVTASTNAPPGSSVNWGWTVDGLPVNVQGPAFDFDTSTRMPGPARVCATAAVPGFQTGSDCTVLTVVDAAPARPIQLTLTAAPNPITPGQRSTVAARTDLAPGTQARYAWTVNGQPVPGDGPDYVFDPAGKAPGTYNVCVTVSAPGHKDARQCHDVVVRACGNPTLTLGAPAKAEIFLGETVQIPTQVKTNECDTPVRISYQASEGRVSAGVYDSTGVAFDMSNRSKLQRKTVTVTANARDELGNTATAQTAVVVKLAPAAQRLDDILFPAGSSRVNNCGKRILLDMLTPRLRDDPEAKILLVGHAGEGERAGTTSRRRRGRRLATNGSLDRARVYNAAAILSAATGICSAVDLGHISVAYAGTSQTSDPRPLLCGSSTQRRSTRISARDPKAQFRRVEVWLVPSGAAMPDVGVPVASAPPATVRARGCPK